MNRRAANIFTAVVGTTGLICVLLATILGWAVIPNIIDNRIEDEVTLEAGSDTYKKWENVPYPVLFQIYVWHVKNPKVNLTAKEIPDLELRGPYIYKETRGKEEIKHILDDDTLEYRQRITYTYDRALSGGLDNMEENLNIVNTPFISASMGIYRMAPFLGPDLIQDTLVARGERFVREGVSVHQMMFDGFQLDEVYKTIIGLLPNEPAEFTGNKFAYYNTRNGKLEDEKYRVKRGHENSLDFGKVTEWDGKLILDHWKIPDWMNVTNPTLQNAYCNMINGTTGEVYRPFIKKDMVLRIYQTEICRSLHVTFDKEIEHRDIPGYQFTMPPEFYQDPEVNGDNFCFCTSPGQFGDGSAYPINRECGEGVIRLGPCKYDSPIVTSNPAFLYAGKQHYDGFITGVVPDTQNPDRHRTTIAVEPNSGSILRISKKLQINVELQELRGIPYFQDVSHFLWPAFYADEAVELDEYWADDLKSRLIKPIKLVKILKWTVLGIGCFLIGLAAAVFLVSRRKSKSYA